MGTQQTVGGILYAGIGGNFRQIATDQGEVVVLASLADTLQALSRVTVTDMPAKGIAGIGRIHDQTAFANQLCRLANQTELGIQGMDLEAL